MSGASGDMAVSADSGMTEPDFFSFYASEVAELLSQVEFGSAQLSSDGTRPVLSSFKKERLKSLLKQSVITLTEEVDEMLDPILRICRIRSCLRYKTNVSCFKGSDGGNQEKHSHKKLKVSPPLDSESERIGSAATGRGLSNGAMEQCIRCHHMTSRQCRDLPDSAKSRCAACESVGDNQGEGRNSDIDIEADTENGIDDDLRILLENDRTMVEELIKKHSDDFLDKIQHMEEKLEELLDSVMSTCRLMTLTEKQHLQRMIRNLPPRNLDRVVEIIQHDKPLAKNSCSEVHVDLEEQDNVTLWRLYYYVLAIEKARKLCEDK